jgi:hypothetical protein
MTSPKIKQLAAMRQINTATGMAVMWMCFFLCSAAIAWAETPAQLSSTVHPPPSGIIVTPKFGGEILGYGVDPFGSQGILSEAALLSNGNILAATETFDLSTGQIVNVLGMIQSPSNDFDTTGVFGRIGLVLYQHNGQGFYLTVNPVESTGFRGFWTPPIRSGYQIGAVSGSHVDSRLAADEFSFDTGNTYVFSSNLMTDTFGPQISLQPIISGTLFFQPLVAYDNLANRAVLADSFGCPEPTCTTYIAVVDLRTGNITEFNDQLGVGTVDGLAVDPTTKIACVATSIDQGIAFYNLTTQTGFEVQIPNAGSALQAGEDVEFDPLHSVFLVSQYSSNGDPNNPQPRVYVYDEHGNVLKTISGLQRIPISPNTIAINPSRRIGFLPVIAEPQHEALELQSFSY